MANEGRSRPIEQEIIREAPSQVDPNLNASPKSRDFPDAMGVLAL